MNIDGKKALVTGASSGIGKSVALFLASKGIHVALVGRDEARLNETADQTAAISDVKTFCCIADLSVEDDARKAVNQAAIALGGLDYLMNCAGVSQRATYKIDEIESAEFHRIMRTNVDSMLYCSGEAMKYLKESTAAYIINILSTAAFSTGAGGGMYSASKYAARALHESMVLGCKGSNIRVSAISPGPVHTDIWSHKIKTVAASKKEKMLQPDNIAEIVWFLLNLDPNVHIDNMKVEPWFYVK